MVLGGTTWTESVSAVPEPTQVPAMERNVRTTTRQVRDTGIRPSTGTGAARSQVGGASRAHRRTVVGDVPAVGTVTVSCVPENRRTTVSSPSFRGAAVSPTTVGASAATSALSTMAFAVPESEPVHRLSRACTAVWVGVGAASTLLKPVTDTA